MARIVFWIPDNAPHPLGENLARAFCAEGRAELGFLADKKAPLGDVNLCYGILYGGAELHARCRAEKKDFVHVDHAFWGRTDDLFSKFKGHFRFSLNSQANIVHGLLTRDDYDRFRAFQTQGLLELQPRRRGGAIYYQPPSTHMVNYWRLKPDFNDVCIMALRRKYPETPVKVFLKGEKLSKIWDDCDTFVSFNSAAGFRALEVGRDAMMSWPINVWPHERGLPDELWDSRRRIAFAWMSGRTFSFDEIGNGEAMFTMARNGEIP